MGWEDFFAPNRKPKNPWANVDFISGANELDNEAALNTPPAPNWQAPGRRRMTEEDFQTPAMDRYLEAASNIPNRDEYSPSIWHRIVGSLAGATAGGTKGPLAGIEGAERVLNMPYQRAIEDYEARNQGLEGAAKLEQSKQKQRMDYEKYIIDAERDDLDREIKQVAAETAQFNADTARQRALFDAQIRKATNQTALDRLQAQKDQWEKVNGQRERELGIRQQTANAALQNAGTNSRRAGAYERYLGGISNKPIPINQIGSARVMAEAQIKNEHMTPTEYPNVPGAARGHADTEPAWFDAQGNILPEFAAEYERQIQERIRRMIRGYGNVPLGAVGALTPDEEENPYEEIQ